KVVQEPHYPFYFLGRRDLGVLEDFSRLPLYLPVLPLNGVLVVAASGERNGQKKNGYETD
ncbi:MAG: hypothetical protein ACOY0S_01375, partial [Patescibacteria group bacterium]